MCGIGIVLGRSNNSTKRILEGFNKILEPRGQDDQGMRTVHSRSGNVLGMAHRRLSIIDLSAAGHQPMVDPESGNAIVFNGEIYNYREIASELEAKGERFQGKSDTEVLLRAYRHYSTKTLLRRLRGMFAFVLWDAQQEKILLARDPCGIKPLYYMHNGSTFAGASEVKAFVATDLVDGQLDPHAIDSFLAFGSVQAPLTIYRGVKSLLPGHMMWVSSDGTSRSPEAYWEWNIREQTGGITEIQESLKTSMRRHLLADVPVGIFLSGGYDSTALATLAMRMADHPVPSFTMTFPEVPEMCEASCASAIADHLGTDHHNIEVRENEFRSSLVRFFKAMDSPSDDGLNVFLLSRGVAQTGIKACIHGVGGDEMFGGYPSFSQVPIAMKLSNLPPAVRSSLAALVSGDSVMRRKLADVLRSDLSCLDVFLIRRNVFSHEQRRNLLGSEPPLGRRGIPTEWGKYAGIQVAEAMDDFGTVSMLELMQYAGNKLLTDGDVMSMAHGVELRFPLLDVDLVRSVLATSASGKTSSSSDHGKPALSQAVADFPIELMSKQKRGFTLPLHKWMRRGLREECRSLTDDLTDTVGLERNAVEMVWRNLDRNKGGQEWLRAWQLYVLGSWCRSRINRLSPAT